ncbi:Rrp15p-domain-containing protein, partial [Pseudomassariella vexata]
QRPSKKQRKQQLRAYNSDDSDEDANPEFKPVNLLDSDNEDLENVAVDDGASSNSDSASGSDSDDETSGRQNLKKRKPIGAKPKPAQLKSAEEDDSASDDEIDESADSDEDSESGSDTGATSRTTKSKRNDPNAFATSLSKILSTKLSTSRRSDPVLSRSAEAHQAAKNVTESALEAKARKQARQQKLLALEKGRVKDVLVATRNEATGEQEASTAEILETEKRLRKVAQRGVVKLYNAIRAAQVRGQEAEREARKEGFTGVKRREEKVNEMSRKGFLDLIASGGGNLKKGALEEA